MREIHKNEQYFFKIKTILDLANLIEREYKYKNCCCLCCPLLGEELSLRSLSVTILDIDERFSYLKEFEKYDLNKPEWLGKRFDIIICDPPFFNVSLTSLHKSVYYLSLGNYSQNLLISYLDRRKKTFLNKFSPFNLKATTIKLEYESLENKGKNRILLFDNLEKSQKPSNLTNLGKNN